MPMKNPPHPGDLIRTEIIEELGLTVKRAADILKVRRATVSDLLHGKAALTPEMALRIEKAFGPDMDHLLRMQLAYDVAKTRQHARDISIKRYFPAWRQSRKPPRGQRSFNRVPSTYRRGCSASTPAHTPSSYFSRGAS